MENKRVSTMEGIEGGKRDKNGWINTVNNISHAKNLNCR